MHSPALLKLLYLVSPSLPVGAYAYSQGQEYAVDSTWVSSESALSDWILGVMRHSLGTTDLPYLIRAYQAWQKNDYSALNEMNQFLRASRETHELLLEDEQLGLAFARLLSAHGIEGFTKLKTKKPSFVLLFALAGLEWQIPLDELLHGFVWSWLENQIAAATKSIPLGQTQAQKILLALLDEIPSVIKAAETLEDDELGSGLPGLAMASSLHERQYSRLFRS